MVATVVSGLIYPLVGHWAWCEDPDGQGWLAAVGFVDFAGSTVVHAVGGACALASAIVIGPRIGRFDDASQRIPSSNLPMAMLGTLLLWLGWIGFNGGSTLELNERVAGTVCNTMLAGAAGTVTALIITWRIRLYSDPSAAINGSLAALVSITAGCHAVSSLHAVIIGAIGAIVMLCADWMLRRARIDDAIGAIPVHGAAGIWGTVAVGLFGRPEVLETGLSRWTQVAVQLAGAFAAVGTAASITYIALRALKTVLSLRVSESEEQAGLNVVEHGATTEAFELLREMEVQRCSDNFTSHVAVEPFTEVGQIAIQYNRVLDRVNVNTSELLKLNEDLQHEMTQRAALQEQLTLASREAGMAEIATGVLHSVGNVLNSVNVSANVLQLELGSPAVDTLVKAAEVISENREDLAEFLTVDQRGRYFPELMQQLADDLSRRRDTQLTEVRSLIDNIDHIKEVVSTQQEHAMARAVAEPVEVVELIHDAIRLTKDSMNQQLMRVEFCIPDNLPVLVTERHKVLQILVHLLTNAAGAVNATDRDDRLVTVTAKADSGFVHISVQDNGVGIPVNHLTRIFGHGYTTKEDGHGFGLHSSAINAQDLGGSLTAHSDGPGYGATFSLRIPVQKAPEVNTPDPIRPGIRRT